MRETLTPQNAYLSEVDPDFAPLIPGIDEVFKKIWTFDTAEELRGKFAGARPTYPPYVPTEGFEISHKMVPVSDGTDVEIRIYRPEGVTDNLPVFYVCHGGGIY